MPRDTGTTGPSGASASGVRYDYYGHWTVPFIAYPSSAGSPADKLRLPVRPVCAGLAADAGFYGYLWAVPLMGVPLFRRWRRVRKGRCAACGYDLSGAAGAECPECGEPVRASTAGSAPQRHHVVAP